MIILLRGHIRDAFETRDLYNLIKNIKKFHTSLEIYIHTWNIFSSNISWRNINIDLREVREKKILNYFADLKQYIKKIIIDNDTKIEVIGDKTGLICSSKCPIIGWKYMWHGIYAGIKSIKDEHDTDEYVLNMRFDVLNNSFSKSHDDIIKFIRVNRNIIEFKKNIFFTHVIESIQKIRGIDNCYIGSINTMYKLIKHFYSNLDSIILNYPNNKCQESMVFLENELIFGNRPISNELVV